MPPASSRRFFSNKKPQVINGFLYKEQIMSLSIIFNILDRALVKRTLTGFHNIKLDSITQSHLADKFILKVKHLTHILQKRMNYYMRHALNQIAIEAGFKR